MAKTKNIHTVTLPNGKTATRTSTSGRAYAHAVAYRRSYESAHAQADRLDIKGNLSNFRWYTEEASKAPGETYIPAQWAEDYAKRLPGRQPHSTTISAEEIERAKAELGGATTVEAYAALKRERALAKLAEEKASGFYDVWVVSGWQSRRDLADKEAARLRGSGYAAEVVVLDATMTTK